MKITAWDKKREQYIPQEEFAITGSGELLIQLNEPTLLYPPGVPSGHYAESEDISMKDIVVTIEEDK